MALYRCMGGNGGGGIPPQLQTDMNAVFNKKFGTTGQSYPSTDWAKDVNVMGLLPEKTASGAIASFVDGADGVPLKTATFDIDPTLDGVSAVNVSHSGADTSDPDVTTISLGQTVYGGSVTVDEDGECDLDMNMTTCEPNQNTTISGLIHTNNNCWAFTLWNMPEVYKQNGIAKSTINGTEQEVKSYSLMTTTGFCKVSTQARPIFTLADSDSGLDGTATSTQVLNAFHTWLSNNTAFAIYEVATPTESDLDPITPINTLLGVNNIWCDTGDSEVIYHVNTNPTANLWGGLKMAQDISKNVTQGYVYQKGNETTIVYDQTALYMKTVLDSSFGFKDNTQYTLIFTFKNSQKYNGNIYGNLVIRYSDGTNTMVQTSGEANTKTKVAIVSDSGKTITSITTGALAGNATIYIDESGLFEGIKTVDDFVPYNRYLIDV